MKHSIDELENVALALENDGAFYAEYLSRRKLSNNRRRSTIQAFTTSLILEDNNLSLIEREILRRYFDKRYDIMPTKEYSQTFRPTDPLPELFAPSDSHTKTFVSVPPRKESYMLKITTITQLNGTNVDTLDDDAIYSAIYSTENKIKELETLQQRPKRLDKKIAELKASIAALVSYLDSKEA